MKEKKKLGLGVWIMIGLAAGIAFGAILWATMGAEAATDFTASYLKPFGDIQPSEVHCCASGSAFHHGRHVLHGRYRQGR